MFITFSFCPTLQVYCVTGCINVSAQLVNEHRTQHTLHDGLKTGDVSINSQHAPFFCVNYISVEQREVLWH